MIGSLPGSLVAVRVPIATIGIATSTADIATKAVITATMLDTEQLLDVNIEEFVASTKVAASIAFAFTNQEYLNTTPKIGLSKPKANSLAKVVGKQAAATIGSISNASLHNAVVGDIYSISQKLIKSNAKVQPRMVVCEQRSFISTPELNLDHFLQKYLKMFTSFRFG